MILLLLCTKSYKMVLSIRPTYIVLRKSRPNFTKILKFGVYQANIERDTANQNLENLSKNVCIDGRLCISY